MNCQTAQDLILEGDADRALEHASGCEECTEFLAVQRALDMQLTQAYDAPVPSTLRAGIVRRVAREKRERWLAALPQAVAATAAIAASGLCALLQPAMAEVFFGLGLGLAAAAYGAQLLFEWLTEEMGEG